MHFKFLIRNSKCLKFNTFYLGVTFITLDKLIPHCLCGIHLHDFHKFILGQTSQDGIYNLFIGFILFLSNNTCENRGCILIPTFKKFPYICSQCLEVCPHFDFPKYKVSSISMHNYSLITKPNIVTHHINQLLIRKTLIKHMSEYIRYCFAT